MPAYELFLIVKNLPRPELVQSIKRSAEFIISRNGVIRSFENLGYKNLPYRMKAKDGYQTTGNYMLIKFDSPRQEVETIMKDVKNEADYLRSAVTRLEDEDEPSPVDCICKKNGQFSKHGFDFEKPMTTWAKKRIYKNYGRRL